jgi:hypothetical protein
MTTKDLLSVVHLLSNVFSEETLGSNLIVLLKKTEGAKPSVFLCLKFISSICV